MINFKTIAFKTCFAIFIPFLIFGILSICIYAVNPVKSSNSVLNGNVLITILAVLMIFGGLVTYVIHYYKMSTDI